MMMIFVTEKKNRGKGKMDRGGRTVHASTGNRKKRLGKFPYAPMMLWMLRELR